MFSQASDVASDLSDKAMGVDEHVRITQHADHFKQHIFDNEGILNESKL